LKKPGEDDEKRVEIEFNKEELAEFLEKLK
jgi:hypothetical protein